MRASVSFNPRADEARVPGSRTGAFATVDLALDILISLNKDVTIIYQMRCAKMCGVVEKVASEMRPYQCRFVSKRIHVSSSESAIRQPSLID